MNDLLKDSCSALLSESTRHHGYGVMSSIHRAAWLANGLQWKEVLDPHYVQGQKPTTNVESEGALVSFGIHPKDWRASGFECPTFDNMRSDGSYAYRGGQFLSHPLYLGMMFTKLLNDPETGRWFLERHKELPPKTNSGSMYTNFWKPSWIPPFKPGDLGVTGGVKPTNHDNISMLAWFDKLEVSHLMRDVTGIGVEDVAGVVSALRIDLSLVEAAEARLHQWWTSSSRLPYAMMAQMLRLTSQLRAETRLSTAKGVRAGFGIVRTDTTEELMVRGLRAISGMTEDGISTFSALYGRPPTLEELRSVGGSGLINILYYMPWDIIEVLLEEDSSALRARTLPHLGALTGEKRHCLQRHNNRTTLLHYAGVEAGPPTRVTDKTNSSDWMKVYSGLAKQYKRSVSIRTELAKIEPDPTVALVAILHRFGGCSREAADRILKHHPAFEKLKDLAATITEPTCNPDHLVGI